MISKVYRLEMLGLWPMAFSAKEEYGVHFGLAGLVTFVTTFDTETGEGKVKKYHLNFGRMSQVSEEEAEVLKHYGIDPEVVKAYASGGTSSLGVQAGIEKMRRASFMLSAISPVVCGLGYNFKVCISMSSYFCTKRVEDIGSLPTEASDYIPKIPESGRNRADSLMFLWQINGILPKGCSAYYDFSLMKLNRDFGQQKPLRADTLREDIMHKLGVGCSMEHNGVCVKLISKDGETSRDALFTGQGVEVARAAGVESFASSGNYGAKKGFGKPKLYGGKLDVRGRETAKLMYWRGEDGKASVKWDGGHQGIVDFTVGLRLDGAHTLPGKQSRRYICSAFDRLPRISELQRMLRYTTGDKEGLSREDAGIILCVLLEKFYPKDAKIKHILERGVISDGELEEVIEQYSYEALCANRQVSKGVSSGADLCRQKAKGVQDGVAVSGDGTVYEDEDIRYVFVEFEMENGKKGCYPRIDYISNAAVNGSVILYVPEKGRVAGRKVDYPVVKLTEDFCDPKWKDFIKGVVLPSTIVQLEGNRSGGVFDGFKHLEMVDLSECKGLKYIGEHAFCACDNLHEIKLPEIESVSESYTIHTGAFMQLGSLGSLKVRAREINRMAFSSISMVSLDLDAEKVGSNAFSKDVEVEGEIKIGSSFTEISSSGLSGLCKGKGHDTIKVELPQIRTLGDNALYRGSELGGEVVLGEYLSSLGSGALYGWENIIVHAKDEGGGKSKSRKPAAATNAFVNIGAVKLHESTSFETEAIKSVPLEKITYFEGEQGSARRREAEEYLSFSTLFLQEQNVPSVVAYLNGMNGTVDLVSSEKPDFEEFAKKHMVAEADPVSFFAGGSDKTYAPYQTDEWEDTRGLLEKALLEALKTVAEPMSPGDANMYSNAGLYAECVNQRTVYASEHLRIVRAKYITADFRTEVYVYVVTLVEEGKDYLFVERDSETRLMSKGEICDFLKIGSQDLGDYAFKEVPSFPYGKDGETVQAPFLMLGDSVRSDSAPTLLGNSLSGNRGTFENYMKSIIASSVLVRTQDRFLLYHPYMKWCISFDNKNETVRVHDNEISMEIPAFCEYLKKTEGKASRKITDSAEFSAYARQATAPKALQKANFGECLEKFAELYDAPRGRLRLSKELFDSLSKNGSYIMSEHDDSGVLASENNLTVSRSTQRRQLMADGKYLQCFASARVTKGKQLKTEDFIEGSSASYRGGKNQVWYRVYAESGDAKAEATYVSRYDVEGLLRHLKSFDFSKGEDAKPIELGKLTAKKRFVFDHDTMPTLFDSLRWYDSERKARVGCAVDAVTGKWYLVSDDITAKKNATGSGTASVSGKLLVLFPIANISFVSAVMRGLAGTDVTSTKSYLLSLLEALESRQKNNGVLEAYREACSELSKTEPNRRKIMELTDFFLAPCLG